MTTRNLVRLPTLGMLACLALFCVAVPDAARATSPHLLYQLPRAIELPDREDLASPVRGGSFAQQAHANVNAAATGAGGKIPAVESVGSPGTELEFAL